MAGHQTFHTPSFGDEEFHLPQLQTSPLIVRGDVNVGASGGAQAVYGMTTTNINSSAAETLSTTAMNNFNTQWPMSNQANDMKPTAGVVTLTGSEFLVLRSPSHQQGSLIPNASNMISPAQSVPVGGVIDQTISSDDSDDNGLSRPENRSLGGSGAAIIDLKSKLKNDPNAPRKPVSAYALFFGDTQAAIKGQNPHASFTEISKIVASMWDVLAPEHKEVYKKKAEDAKKEYRRLMTIYRTNLLAKSEEQANQRAEKLTSPGISASPNVSHPAPAMQQGQLSTAGFNVPTITNPLGISTQSQQSTVVPTTTMPNSNSMQNETAANSPTNTVASVQPCIRNGCQNQAIVSPDWEDEYCSNECVVSHCAEIFSKWVQDNSTPEAYAAAT